MTIREAIQWVDDIKPNSFSDETKLKWLSALEGRLALNVFLLAGVELRYFQYGYPADMDAELLVQPPHDDIYTAYLAAKIDEANGEYELYQNSMTTYNGLFGGFARWFARTYEPAQGYRFGGCLNGYV